MPTSAVRGAPPLPSTTVPPLMTRSMGRTYATPSARHRQRVASDSRVVKAGRVVSGNGLVGREAELAMATAAFCDVESGRFAALAIEGEAGIGKTRLVRRLVDDARARG